MWRDCLRRVADERVGSHLSQLERVKLERVMDVGENRIEMRIPRSAWFLRDLRFPHS
jgi:hypothetical protein